MPWLPPVVAHTDNLGYLWCLVCRPELQENPRYADERFDRYDICERCGTRLERVPNASSNCP